MKERKNKRSGISLIVLVITIIVMLILAGAIIITLSNTNIINKATEAVDKTNTSQVQTLANTAFVNAYAKGNRAVADLKDEVIKELNKSGISADDYYVIVTPEGVEIKSKKTWTPEWTQDGSTITNGTLTLEVGDYVDYKAGVSGYSDEKGWKVLGAENGRVVLVSTNVVGELELGADSPAGLHSNISKKEAALKEAQNDWATAVEQLDNVCKPFGKGTHAEYARSMNIDDIDRVTKSHASEYKNIAKPYKNYGAEIVYKYGGGKEIRAFYGDQEIELKANLSTGIIWYDYQDKIWCKANLLKLGSNSTISVIVDDNDSTKQAKIKNSDRGYGWFDIIEEGSGLWYILLGNNEDGQGFWLANPYVRFWEANTFYSVTTSSEISRNILSMYDESVLEAQKDAVKATVVLKEGVTFTPDEQEGCWKIN